MSKKEKNYLLISHGSHMTYEKEEDLLGQVATEYGDSPDPDDYIENEMVCFKYSEGEGIVKMRVKVEKKTTITAW